MAQLKLPHDHGQEIDHIMKHSPSPEEFLEISDLLRQLGDSSRLRLFWILCHCEECVINLSAMMGMSSPAISHHLKQLRVSGLITSRRDGKEVYYKAADNVRSQLLHRLTEQMIEHICPVPEDGSGPSEDKDEDIEIIRAIHRQLTEHPDRRFTIEELSKQYLINTSSLKAIFKSVYGAPLAAYMKEYRMQKAARLLCETGDSIAGIAAQVGYENQSKFTAAFKEVFQTLPTVYRRQNRK